MTVREDLEQIQGDTSELVRLAERSRDLSDDLREEILGLHYGVADAIEQSDEANADRVEDLRSDLERIEDSILIAAAGGFFGGLLGGLLTAAGGVAGGMIAATGGVAGGMIAAEATHDEGRRVRKAIQKSGTDSEFAHAERAVLRLICSALRSKPLPPEQLIDLLSHPSTGIMTRPKARLWLAHFRTRGCVIYAAAGDSRAVALVRSQSLVEKVLGMLDDEEIEAGGESAFLDLSKFMGATIDLATARAISSIEVQQYGTEEKEGKPVTTYIVKIYFRRPINGRRGIESPHCFGEEIAHKVRQKLGERLRAFLEKHRPKP